jgi:hypothetical protein
VRTRAGAARDAPGGTLRLRWWVFWGIAGTTAFFALDAAWGGDAARAVRTLAWLMGLPDPLAEGP